MDKRHQILLDLLISLAVFALIFYLVGFGKIISLLLMVKLEFILAALAAYAMLNVAMSYRIKVVLKSIGNHLSIMQIIPSSVAGMLASDFTPARVGYFFTAFSLSSKFKISLEKTMVAIFGPQLLDFLIKALSATIIIILITDRVGGGGLLLNAIALLLFLAAILLAGLLVFYPPFVDMLSFMQGIPLLSSVFGFLRRMHVHSDSVLAVKWQILWITLLSWSLKGIEWLCLSRALGIALTGSPISDFLFLLVFQGAITIIQFLPLPTVAGAGASEAGFAAVLIVFGVPLEAGIAFAFLTRLLMIAVDSLALPVIMAYLHSHDLERTLSSIMKLEH